MVRAVQAILRTEDEVKRSLTAPAADALELQHPLPDEVLMVAPIEAALP